MSVSHAAHVASADRFDKMRDVVAGRSDVRATAVADDAQAGIGRARRGSWAVGRRMEPAGQSGRSGIRTHERVAPLTVFKTVAFVRSAILPRGSLSGDPAGASYVQDH